MTRRRPGLTLLELMVSLTTSGILLVGMSSALFIALQATNPSSSSTPATLAGLDQLTMMFTELQHALTITEQNATAITVTVADRDGDMAADVIRYAWSGTEGDPLTRQLNAGASVSVVEEVEDFDIEYYAPAGPVEYLTIMLQVTNDANAAVQTAIPLLNRP